MSKPVEFSDKIVSLLCDMKVAKQLYQILEVGRGEMQQAFYFITGKSKINGITEKGNHQLYTAMDIMLVNPDGSEDWTEDHYQKWHDVWVQKYGGKPMIVFKDGTKDIPHFEL